jgi:tetratricopeptide (TPR) repeat protein
MVNYANTCFVVMPFGSKKLGRRTIDFDSIYDSVFLPAISRVAVPEGGSLEPRRTDRDFFTGDITVEMFRYLEYSRFVLADITGLNANVFYELGVRHRARQSGTAIFRQVDVKLPFDISHIKAFPYEYRPEKSAEASRQLIAKVLSQSLLEDKTDNVIRLAIAQQEQRPRPDVENLLQSAENALRREDTANAVQCLRRAVQADPASTLARVKLGILLKEQGGKWSEAAEQFDAAVKIASGYADAWRELGIAQGKIGQGAAGEQSLKQALQLNPTDFDALASLGGILKRRGDLQGALQMYRESARVSNGHSYPLLNALTLEAHLRGSLDLSQDRIALFRAERSLRAQTTDEPPYNVPWSFFDLAQTRLFQGDREGFLDNITLGIQYCTADWMPKTFRSTLELLPEQSQQFPGLDEGIVELKKAELELAPSASKAQSTQ